MAFFVASPYGRRRSFEEDASRCSGRVKAIRLPCLQTWGVSLTFLNWFRDPGVFGVPDDSSVGVAFPSSFSGCELGLTPIFALVLTGVLIGIARKKGFKILEVSYLSMLIAILCIVDRMHERDLPSPSELDLLFSRTPSRLRHEDRFTSNSKVQ